VACGTKHKLLLNTGLLLTFPDASLILPFHQTLRVPWIAQMCHALPCYCDFSKVRSWYVDSFPLSLTSKLLVILQDPMECHPLWKTPLAIHPKQLHGIWHVPSLWAIPLHTTASYTPGTIHSTAFIHMVSFAPQAKCFHPHRQGHWAQSESVKGRMCPGFVWLQGALLTTTPHSLSMTQLHPRHPLL
jgi:hypothetical protein